MYLLVLFIIVVFIITTNKTIEQKLHEQTITEEYITRINTLKNKVLEKANGVFFEKPNKRSNIYL
jgi:hypothetical protein